MAVSLNQSNSHGRGGRRRTLNANSEINVTPMVDVMLVLLIVFMVTAPLLSVGVPVDLPKTKAAKMNDQIEPLVVTIDAAGRSYLQEMEVSGEALIARLMAVTNNNPDARIYVRGDQKIAYGRIMEIMGSIAAAGYTKVSLLAELPKPGKTPQAPVVASSVPQQASKGVAPIPPRVAPIPQQKPALSIKPTPQGKPVVVPGKVQRS